MKAIVMAGGSGTRLWPLSRGKYPKQFVKLKGMRYSLFQMTIDRCLGFCGWEDIYVVTNKDYEFLVKSQIDEMEGKAESIHVLLEPQMKNTLPAIYNGVKAIRETGDDVVVVMPSDHLIKDTAGFVSQVRQGEKLAADYIFTFGIQPTFPETGFGYIRPGEALQSGFKVREFKEKPDYATAEQYVAAGYLWNGGIFMFDTALFDEEVKTYAPEVYAAFLAGTVEERFEKAPRISIDYGIMEKSARVAVLPLAIDWDDLGSFATFYETYAANRDADGNVLLGDAISIDAKDCLIYPDDGKKVTALIGTEDLIVVDQPDALLICRKDRTQDVKGIVDSLKMRGDSRKDYHITEYRPWGSFTILEEGSLYKIKRLTVTPGKQLSYQMHYHRSEHWIVVAGTATVTIDDENYLVRSGESIFVNIGAKHRLANDGKLLLEVIEVQSGQYLGEDDIVRFNDDFGRC